MALLSTKGTPSTSGSQSARLECTLGQVADAAEALKHLSNSAVDVATAFRLVRLKRWAQPHQARFLQARDALLEKYGKATGEGKWELPNADAEAFLKDLADVREQTVTMDAALRIDVGELRDVKLAPSAAEPLGIFLKGYDV